MLFIIQFFILSSVFASQPGIVFTQEGEEIHGEILKIAGDSVYMRRIDGKDTTIEISSLLRIQFLRQIGGDYWHSVDDVTDTLLLRLVRKYLGKEPRIKAGADVLFEEKIWRLSDDLRWTFEHRRITRLNTQEGIEHESAKFYFYFADDSSIELLFARGIDLDGNITNITESSIEYSSPFGYIAQYDRLRRLKFALGGLSVGSIMDYKIRLTMARSSYFQPFAAEEPMFERYPVLEKIVRIEVPAEIGIRLFVSMKDKVKIDSVFSNTKREYIVRVEKGEMVLDEPMMPPEVYVVPKVFFSIYSSWDSLANGIFDKIKEAYDKPEILDNIIDSLRRANPEPIMLAKSLYYWVLSNFVFENVPVSQFRPYPLSLSKLFQTRCVGDLDAAFVYFSLLSRAGFDPDIVFVRAADCGFLPDSVVSVNYFSFPIVRFHIDGERFVYVKSPYYNFGTLPADAFGKTGLSIKSGKIIRTMAWDLDDTRTVTRYNAELDDSLVLHVEKEVEAYGRAGVQKKIEARSMIANLRRKEELDLNEKYPSFALESLRFWGVGFDSIPFFEIKYTGRDFFNAETGDIVAFRIPELVGRISYEGESKKKYPVYIGEPLFDEVYFVMRLPQWIVPLALPPAARFSYGPFYYDFKPEYDSESSTIFLSVIEKITPGLYSLADYEHFKEYQRVKLESLKGWLVLKKLHSE